MICSNKLMVNALSFCLLHTLIRSTHFTAETMESLSVVASIMVANEKLVTSMTKYWKLISKASSRGDSREKNILFLGKCASTNKTFSYVGCQLLPYFPVSTELNKMANLLLLSPKTDLISTWQLLIIETNNTKKHSIKASLPLVLTFMFITN